MIVYVVADADTGAVLALHHEVDAEGRSVRCRQEDVLTALPPGVEADRVTVLSAELDRIPSSRDAAFAVDLKRRRVTLEPVPGGREQHQPAEQQEREPTAEGR